MILKRVSSTDKGTFGVLLDDSGIPLPGMVTLEDPWNDNKNEISCIPLGEYKCVPRWSLRHKHHWVLEGVPKRSLILIHIGNSIANTRGCILVGTSFGGQGIVGSKDAMERLRAQYQGKSFTLKII